MCIIQRILQTKNVGVLGVRILEVDNVGQQEFVGIADSQKQVHIIHRVGFGQSSRGVLAKRR